MNLREKLEREVIKDSLKMCIIINPNLNEWQKQQELDRIECSARQVDFMVETIKRFLLER